MTTGSERGDKDRIRLIAMQHIAGYDMPSCGLQLLWFGWLREEQAEPDMSGSKRLREEQAESDTCVLGTVTNRKAREAGLSTRQMSSGVVNVTVPGSKSTV